MAILPETKHDKGTRNSADQAVLDRKRAGQGRGLFGRIAAVTLSLSVLVLFAGLIWYAYNWAYGDQSPDILPLITAEASPIKVKPEDEGGKAVLHQESLILNQSMAAQEEIPKVEHLLPAPEEPAVLEPIDETPSAPAVEAATEMPSVSEGEATESATAEAAAQAPAGEVDVAEVPVVTPPEAAPEPAAAEATEEPAEAPAKSDPIGDLIAENTGETAAPAAETETPDENTETQTGQTQTGQTQTAQTQTAQTQTAQVPTDGGYVIQLLAATSKAGAQSEWDRLKARHAALLGDMALQIQTITKSGTTYHRVQTGPFPTRATAGDLCGQLKAAGQDCIVKKK